MIITNDVDDIVYEIECRWVKLEMKDMILMNILKKKI